MPLVTITGYSRDHGLKSIPASAKPELWFRPNRGNSSANGLLLGVETKAEWVNIDTGQFTVDLFSDGSTDIWYTPVERWLCNPEEPKPEKWSYGYFEWPHRVYPDLGGSISDLIDIVPGVGLVYVSDSAPDSSKRYQLQYNPKADWLYERKPIW